MIRVCSAFALGAALLVASGSAAQVPEPAGSSFQLSKVVLDTETTEANARVKGGTLCVFPSTIKLPKKKQTLSYERFDNLFSQRLKTAGLTVVNTSADLFAGEEDKNKADYLIGAVMRIEALNLCSSVAGEKGDATVKIEWQVYDRAAGRVIDTVTLDGRGVQEKFVSDGLDQMLNQAFLASLGALIEQNRIQRYAQPIN